MQSWLFKIKIKMQASLTNKNVFYCVKRASRDNIDKETSTKFDLDLKYFSKNKIQILIK